MRDGLISPIGFFVVANISLQFLFHNPCRGKKLELKKLTKCVVKVESLKLNE